MLKIIFSIFFTSLLLNASDFQEQKFLIQNIKDNTAQINVGSLKIGQSGIIIHNFNFNKSIILAKAHVIKTNDNSSVIEFSDEKILEQNSIATSNLKASKNDVFILNHMYNVSLLITPNFESYKNIVTTHDNNFIDSELFAAYLKINEIAAPSAADIQTFTRLNNISTLYIVVENDLFILDTSTFKVIKTKKLLIKDKSTQVPFYTNIENIKTAFFDFSSLTKIDDYNKYYKKIIRNK